MYLEDTWRLPPLHDECFSSWLYRVSLRDACLTDKIEKKFGFTFSYSLDYVVPEPILDPDYGLVGLSLASCCEALSIDQDFFKEKFFSSFTWIIPRPLRTSYCFECMRESVAICGLPICRKSWGVMQLPFCNKHKLLLKDGASLPTYGIDAAVFLFKNHWNDDRVTQKILKENFHWLDLAYKVQEAIYNRPDLFSYLPYKMLMQLILQPGFYFTTSEWNFNAWGKTDNLFCYSKPSRREKFQSDPLHASTIVRAKALCYFGCILRIISDEEINDAFRKMYFSPSNYEDIICNFQRYMKSPYLATSVSLLIRSVDDSLDDGLSEFIHEITYGR
jgi:hypothetical protein